MTRFVTAAISTIVLSAAALASQAAPQTVDPATRFVQIANNYSVAADITYLRAGGADLKLDVYRPSNAAGPTPVLMFMHGGGGRTDRRTARSSRSCRLSRWAGRW